MIETVRTKMRNSEQLFQARLKKFEAPMKKVTKSVTSCQPSKVVNYLRLKFYFVLKGSFINDRAENEKKIEKVEKIESTQNVELVEYTKTEEKNIKYGDLELQTDPNISLSVNEPSIITNSKQCKARVISSTDNSDQDILDTVARKIQDLNEADSRLASDIRENDEAGKRLIDCIDQHGTQAEVRKLVIHISQVEQVNNLLMLLTNMLARAERIESRDRKLLQRKVRIRKQIEDAETLRQYRNNQGNLLKPIVLKYSRDFWPRFEMFLEIKVKLIIEQWLLKEKIYFYMLTMKELSTDFNLK